MQTKIAKITIKAIKILILVNLLDLQLDHIQNINLILRTDTILANKLFSNLNRALITQRSQLAPALIPQVNINKHILASCFRLNKLTST
jgi:hypothetical protein